MAGCILGGGTAVNADLWWNVRKTCPLHSANFTYTEQPNPTDWDYNFPTGWKSADMAASAARVFSRIPGTDLPSMDGKRYIESGYNVVSSGLAKAGWKSVTANSVPG